MPEIVVEPAWKERLNALLPRRRDAWVLTGVVTAVVVGALLMWTRGAPAKIAPPAVEAPGATTSPTAVILVHVAGAVARPGLYELPDGARVADAIDAAGGPRRNADLDSLNLAQVLVDGLKVDVVRLGDVAVGAESGAASIISINSADASVLEGVPGIGPVKAAAIVQYRDEIGSFSSIEQLLEVSGIGPATLESIAPYLTL
jgi:competence protein ComEA